MPRSFLVDRRDNQSPVADQQQQPCNSKQRSMPCCERSENQVQQQPQQQQPPAADGRSMQTGDEESMDVDGRPTLLAPLSSSASSTPDAAAESHATAMADDSPTDYSNKSFSLSGRQESGARMSAFGCN
jgi:hypothetical protein